VSLGVKGVTGDVVPSLDIYLLWMCLLSNWMWCAGVTLWYLHMEDCGVVDICLIALSTIR
jgi:hypothetical protein